MGWELLGPILGALVVVLITNALSYHYGQRSTKAEVVALRTVHEKDVNVLHGRISRHSELEGHPVHVERTRRMEREFLDAIGRVEKRLDSIDKHLGNGLP